MAHNDAADGMTSEQPTYEFRLWVRRPLDSDEWIARKGGEWYVMSAVTIYAGSEVRIERRIVGPWEKVEL